MERKSYMSLWLILSGIQALMLVAIVFMLFNAIVFPNGRIFSPIDERIEIIVVFTIVGLLILYSLRSTLRFARKKIIASDTFNNAVVNQAFVTVISKLARGFSGLALGESQYLVAVEFPDRTRVSFDVDAMQYSVIVEGDTGLLTYKQNNEHFFFVNFQRQPH